MQDLNYYEKIGAHFRSTVCLKVYKIISVKSIIKCLKSFVVVG